jgi:hypothetical protein
MMFRLLKKIWRYNFMNTRCNRPITAQERRDHFSRHKSQGLPWYQMAVIRMNSTHLECVDRMFEERGMMTAIGIILQILIIWLIAATSLLAVEQWPELSPDRRTMEIWDIIGTVALFSPLTVMILFILKQELFQYTHYPIRFNRKTRKVYVFRRDGTVLTVFWRDIYFTVITQSFDRRRVAMLILDKDRETVIEEVMLPFVTDKNDHKRMHSFFEFVRCYMDESEAKVYMLSKQIDYVPKIVNRRQTFFGGWYYMDALFTGGYIHLRFGYYLTTLLFYIIGRWIVMHTCRIPRWPKEVEDECQFEPNDPCLRDEKHLSKPGTVQMPW